MSSDKDCLVKYLQMKQNICTKRLQLQTHEQRAIKVKDELKNKVIEVHLKLAKYLNDLKTESFKSVDLKTDDIFRDLNDKIASLNSLEAELNRNLEKRAADVDVGIPKFKSNALDIESKLIKKLEENPEIPDAEFHADKALENAILEFRNGLGEVKVQILDHDGYRRVRMYVKGLQGPTESKNDSKDESGAENIAPQIPPRSVNRSGKLNKFNLSPIVRYNGTGESYHGDDPVGSDINFAQRPTKTKDPKCSSKSKVDDASKSTATPQTSDVKESGLNWLFDKFRTKDKKATKNDLYEDFKLVGSRRAHPRYLINKSISVSGLASDFKSACKFSKLIPLGVDRLGLLSDIHSTVVVTDLHGKIHCLSNYRGLKSFVAIKDDQLAVLIQEPQDGTIIRKFRVGDKGFEQKSCIDLKLDKSDITGFDYYKNNKRYAISTAVSLIVTDDKGKIIKTSAIESVTGSLDIATTYDFENDFIHVLNKTLNTFKCVSLTTMEAIWKRKCDVESVKPKSICLYKEKLCIAFSTSVTIVAAKDGQPIRKHDTFDLVKNCFGICVIEDVIVVSSESDEFDESTNLAFISL